MSYRIPKISPSALAATEHCPRFRPDGKENDAAQEGTALHECLENLVSVPVDQWPSWIKTRPVSPDHKGLLEEAASQLQVILMGWDDFQVFRDFRLRMRNKQPRKTKLRPGLYPECEIERDKHRHGFIDLMIVKPDGMITIIDWKFVRQEGHDYTLQLGAYACDVNRLCPAHTEFECRIVAPRLPSESVETHLWGAEDLAELRKRIAAIELRADESANDDSINGCPNDACQYCHWAGRCKYQAQAALQVAVHLDVISMITRGTEYEDEVLSRQTFMKPATPTQRGLRRVFVKFLKSVVEQWTEDDKTWTAANRGVRVPGWKIGWRAGRASLDKTRMSDIRAALISKLGMSSNDVELVSAVDVSLLKDFLVQNLGYSEKEATKKVQEALDEFMTVGGSYTVWTQDKPKVTSTAGAIDV